MVVKSVAQSEGAPHHYAFCVLRHSQEGRWHSGNVGRMTFGWRYSSIAGWNFRAALGWQYSRARLSLTTEPMGRINGLAAEPQVLGGRQGSGASTPCGCHTTGISLVGPQVFRNFCVWVHPTREVGGYPIDRGMSEALHGGQRPNHEHEEEEHHRGRHVNHAQRWNVTPRDVE